MKHCDISYGRTYQDCTKCNGVAGFTIQKDVTQAY
jgi:hypothetical protein